MPNPTNPTLSSMALPRGTILAVIALGITQIIAWGTSFYALGVLGQPIAVHTGWSSTIVFGGFTLAVLAASAISTPAGWAIDRYGARGVMSAGIVLLAASLAALSHVVTPPQYFIVWSVIGLAMRLTLYDAAFAALVQIDPSRGRRAIAYLTLFGGFASTVGWPAGHWLNEWLGWRDTFLMFAAANLIVCLPLIWFGLPGKQAPDTNRDKNAGVATENRDSRSASEPLEGRARLVAMALFSVVMSANAFVFGVGAIHLVGLIESAGVAVATAVWLASLKGVAQVGGRLWELVFGENLSPMMLGRIAIGLLPLAFVVLLVTGGPAAALIFTLTFGASNGLVTIVRGAVPLALFGPKGYGMILGIIATPILLFNAISPLAFALIVERIGFEGGTWLLLAIALLASVAMEVLSIWYRRQQEVPGCRASTLG